MVNILHEFFLNLILKLIFLKENLVDGQRTKSTNYSTVSINNNRKRLSSHELTGLEKQRKFERKSIGSLKEIKY